MSYVAIHKRVYSIFLVKTLRHLMVILEGNRFFNRSFHSFSNEKSLNCVSCSSEVYRNRNLHLIDMIDGALKMKSIVYIHRLSEKILMIPYQGRNSVIMNSVESNIPLFPP
jgi:hypothetical protein